MTKNDEPKFRISGRKLKVTTVIEEFTVVVKGVEIAIDVTTMNHHDGKGAKYYFHEEHKNTKELEKLTREETEEFVQMFKNF